MLDEKSNRNKIISKGFFPKMNLNAVLLFHGIFFSIVMGEIILNLVLSAVLPTLSSLLLLGKF